MPGCGVVAEHRPSWRYEGLSIWWPVRVVLILVLRVLWLLTPFVRVWYKHGTPVCLGIFIDAHVALQAERRHVVVRSESVLWKAALHELLIRRVIVLRRACSE